MEKKCAIRMENITKRFGSKVIANKNVNLDLYEGEILSLLGENGSGKTTLMNIRPPVEYLYDLHRLLLGNGHIVDLLIRVNVEAVFLTDLPDLFSGLRPSSYRSSQSRTA